VVKRIAILVTLFACVGLSFFLSVPARTASAQTGQVELACPAGSSPMPIVGQTFNISTGKFRQWLCVDTSGNITQATGAGASPGGANTNVQFNNAGAFGGTSSFTYDGATTVSIGNGGAGALVVNSSSSPSATGAIRLPISGGAAKTGIGWRNNANSADLILLPNTSDQLTFNGTVLPTESTWTSSVFSFAATGVQSRFILARAHTLTRFQLSLQGVLLSCTTSPVVAFRDLTVPSTLASFTVANGVALADSGAVSVSMTAGDTFGVEITTAGVGCTGGNGPTFTAVFQ
jgi:hypothetical protein